MNDSSQIIILYILNLNNAVLSLGQEYPLEKEMATHSIILVWNIQTEELDGLQSIG